MRKSLKKVCSSIISSVLAVSAMPIVLGAAAAEDDNILSVSTQILTNGTVVNDTVIPAGSVAISVNISDNSGFNSTTTKLHLGEAYDIIVFEDNKPVVSNGSLLQDSIVNSATNENYIAVVSASGSSETSDGELFTFYAIIDETSLDDSIEFVEDEITISDNIINGSSGNFYVKGDCNDDDVVNAVDASYVLSALQRCGQSALPYSIASLPNMYLWYFPDIYVIDAAYIWSDNRDITAENTADIITDYYSMHSVGLLYPHEDGLLIGYAFPVSSSS